MTPREQHDQLERNFPGALIGAGECHGVVRVFLLQADLPYCSVCGGLVMGVPWEQWLAEQPPAPPFRLEELDLARGGAQIKAAREIHAVSITQLADLVAVRADRLCRFEAGTVKADEIEEFIRALVWTGANVEQFRKEPITAEDAKGAEGNHV